MRATVLCLFVLLAAVEAAAQSPPAARRWDLAAETGVFANHPPNTALVESYDDWYHSPIFSLTAGRYLTSHVKVEGELLLSAEGGRYGQRLVDVSRDRLQPVAVDQMTRTDSGSLALAWQFFDNQWVHPFVLAGVSVDFDRTTVRTAPYYVGDPRVVGSQLVLTPGGVDALGTTTTARALIGGGAKLYVSPRAFFRADTRIGIGTGSSGHVAFRLGFGVDF